MGYDMGQAMKERYQLRKAAGSYWLLDMHQTGRTKVNPIPLNESGASIWKKLQEGKSVQDIAESFHEEYGITVQEASVDIEQFLEQVKKQGIVY